MGIGHFRRGLSATAFFLLLLSAWGLSAQAERAVRFESPGIQLPGCQLQYDGGFDFVDWNGDGLLDLFLPVGGFHSFAVQQNEGSATEPLFTYGLRVPLNLTETVPQTVEHNQTFAIGDLNGDGLFDLIVYDGELRLILNTGQPYAPNHWNLAGERPHFFPGSEKMVRENARYVTGPESMFWGKGIFPRLVLTLVIADWDEDGLQDLIICRFRQEAPGVTPTGAVEQWTSWGRTALSKPRVPPPPVDAPTFLGPLKAAPARGVYFYRNKGTKEKPWFDEGVEILTPDGQPLAAPNPVVADVDGDGVPDLVSTETAYIGNAYRVDWPTATNVQWFRRLRAAEPAVVAPAQPLRTAAGQPVPAGVQARWADVRGTGSRDLFVLDVARGLRWYRNTAATGKPPALQPPTVLSGKDFARYDFMYQPLVVDWYGPGSRDLILHGNIDAHCKWSLRRTALYRNVATRPGELKYDFVGWINYQGDPAMVPQTFPFEERPYDVYGSAISVMPADATRRKRLVMSVNGALYLFTDLSADGLTFKTRTSLNIPNPGRNRMRGWQEIPVDVPDKVKYIRLGNDRNGMGNLRDSFLPVINFEALAGGRNLATTDAGAVVRPAGGMNPHWPNRDRLQAMLTPGNAASDETPNFTVFGFWLESVIVELSEPVKLDKIRFLLSDREYAWYNEFWPFYWQGRLYRRGTERGEPWYNYRVEVSADQQNWVVVADRMRTEMMRSFPCLVDWDGDGKHDLLLGVLNSNGIWPREQRDGKEYRLYRNQGDNDTPKYTTFEPLRNEKGEPLTLPAYWYHAYALQCGVAALELDSDGKRDLVVEEQRGNRLVYYRNVSDKPGGVQFQLSGPLGDPQPLDYDGRYRYFFVGDVDGDAVPDVINCASSTLTFFKGTSASAPIRVGDLLCLGAETEGLSLQWTRPVGATRYELRWCADEPLSEANWQMATAVSGEYTAAEKERQAALLPRLPAGARLCFAVKSRNTAGEQSALSNCVETVTPPLRRIVLRNGPQGPDGLLAYQGCQACYLDARKPAEVMPGEVLEVYARGTKESNPRVILLRFRDLPVLDNLQRATVSLTTPCDPNLLQAPHWPSVSGYAFRDDWEAATATYDTAAPGRAWAGNELTSGGTFLAHHQPLWTVEPQHTLTWDVTAAAREALREGHNTLSLLLRVDYAGPYIAELGYRLCGASHPDVNARPRLTLIGRAER